MKILVGIVIGATLSIICINNSIIKVNKNEVKLNINKAKKIVSRTINKRK